VNPSTYCQVAPAASLLDRRQVDLLSYLFIHSMVQDII